MIIIIIEVHNDNFDTVNRPDDNQDEDVDVKDDDENLEDGGDVDDANGATSMRPPQRLRLSNSRHCQCSNPAPSP